METSSLLQPSINADGKKLSEGKKTILRVVMIFSLFSLFLLTSVIIVALFAELIINFVDCRIYYVFTVIDVLVLILSLFCIGKFSFLFNYFEVVTFLLCFVIFTNNLYDYSLVLVLSFLFSLLIVMIYVKFLHIALSQLKLQKCDKFVSVFILLEIAICFAVLAFLLIFTFLPAWNFRTSMKQARFYIFQEMPKKFYGVLIVVMIISFVIFVFLAAELIMNNISCKYYDVFSYVDFAIIILQLLVMVLSLALLAFRMSYNWIYVTVNVICSCLVLFFKYSVIIYIIISRTKISKCVWEFDIVFAVGLILEIIVVLNSVIYVVIICAGLVKKGQSYRILKDMKIAKDVN